MILPPREVRLKDGRICILRSAQAEDAPFMLDLMKSTAEETHFLMRYPEEGDMTLKEEEAFVKAAAESENRLMVLPFVKDVLIGSCMLVINSHIKTRHRASFGLAVLKEYWGLGVGVALIDTVAQAAQARGVQLLELEVIQGNVRAQRLYERMGFRTVGEHPNAIRLKDGTLLTENLMAMDLTVKPER